MGGSRSFACFIQQELGRFPQFVIYVLLEWFMILILFIDAFLALIANGCARIFELRIPCWLCTRFDHTLVHRNPDFYYDDSVCERHKKEISSMAFCHNHKKLSDIRNMCEGCLLSFATERESDIDTYKSLVGILHKDLECFVEDDQQIQMSLKDDGFMNVDKSNNKRCSCCGGPLRLKPPQAKLKLSASSTRAPSPSPRAYQLPAAMSEEPAAPQLPHVQYTELKFLSDNDSDIVDDGDSSTASSQNFKIREDSRASSVPLLSEAEDSPRHLTPNFKRENKFFGIPLTDNANGRTKKSPNTAFAAESNDEIAHQNDLDDAILSHLKRQVRLDRKSLMDLYMELDEERSASAIAANNAMAMITRLQTEKAAVQMEALQYQRMMEEQAEYDDEALQATTDMLLKREEEIKALEAELDNYRNKFGSLADDVLKEAPLTHNDGVDSLQNGLNSNQVVSSHQAENGGGKVNESMKDVKGEKTHLIARIKKVENRTHIAENGVHSIQSSTDTVNNIVDNVTGKGSEASLPRALSSLTEKVKELEANNGFIEKNSEGTKILTEISQQLEKLNHLVMASA